VARDDIVRLSSPLKEGTHQEGEDKGWRLGGGGSNTGVALARAGHHVLLFSAVGSDETAGFLLGELSKNGIDTSHIAKLPGASSRAIILLDPMGERTIVNVARRVDPDATARLKDIVADGVYVRSRASGLGAILSELSLRLPTLAHIPPLIPNSLPVRFLVGSAGDLDAGSLADPWAAGQRVAGQLLEWIVITDGAKGAWAYGPEGQVIHQPAQTVTPLDGTGAGDAFAAGLLHALVKGDSIRKALITASAWGAKATLYEGSIVGRDFPPVL
jgi:sugar/nucleoside kinase (ribokinase family)